MDPLVSLAAKKAINLKLAPECLEKLIEAAVVYVPVQLINCCNKGLHRIFDVCHINVVFSSEEKAPKGLKLLKYYLNPSYPIDSVYMFDTNTFPFVTNDKEYFKQMYNFYSECNRCIHSKEFCDFTFCKYKVDDDRSMN